MTKNERRQRTIELLDAGVDLHVGVKRLGHDSYCGVIHGGIGEFKSEGHNPMEVFRKLMIQHINQVMEDENDTQTKKD